MADPVKLISKNMGLLQNIRNLMSLNFLVSSRNDCFCKKSTDGYYKPYQVKTITIQYYTGLSPPVPIFM